MSERMKEAANLLKEIEEMIRRELERRMDDIEKITSRLEVIPKEYKELMVAEVVFESGISIDVQFAFSPWSESPEKIKEKALKLLEKKLRRDRRLYLSA